MAPANVVWRLLLQLWPSTIFLFFLSAATPEEAAGSKWGLLRAMARMRKTPLLLLLSGLPLSTLACGPAAPKNVLFIMVDDLRPTLGAYGDPLAQTPNIDQIAAEGLAFQRAYAQQAQCNPSRTSLLTGYRPDTTRVFDLEGDFRDALPEIITLPQLFKRAGFVSRAVGKVHHGSGELDDLASWSVKPSHPKTKQLGRAASPEEIADKETGTRGSRSKNFAFNDPDVEDDVLVDGEILREALQILDEIADRPFFLAVGFKKPHLPFIAPKKYWDLYPPEAIVLPASREAPIGGLEIASSNSQELRKFPGIRNEGPLDEATEIELSRGYYACVSYVDALIGRLVEDVKRRGLWDETVVVVWGDHGFHLGEHGLWAKKTNYEAATRAPLIVRVPGMKTAGRSSDALIEFVDVYPTLAEIFGLEAPSDLEGTSFAPVIENPKREWKRAVFSQHPRAHADRDDEIMGRSVRTDRYRLTQWRLEDEFWGAELYDYVSDPDETRNLADDVNLKKTKLRMLRQLRLGWKDAAQGLPGSPGPQTSSRPGEDSTRPSKGL